MKDDVQFAGDFRTISVPEAGKVLGISRNSSYSAARRGELPILKIGCRYRVPVAALKRMLDAFGTKQE